MKIVVAPDSFKESMTAKEACDSIERGIVTVFPYWEIDLVQSVKENRTCDDFLFFVIAIKNFLGQLNVPVRKLIPDEVVEEYFLFT